jgi:hypothetical protein
VVNRHKQGFDKMHRKGEETNREERERKERKKEKGKDRYLRHEADLGAQGLEMKRGNVLAVNQDLRRRKATRPSAEASFAITETVCGSLLFSFWALN